MGVSLVPHASRYRADNPFVDEEDPPPRYRVDNPFAADDEGPRAPAVPPRRRMAELFTPPVPRETAMPSDALRGRAARIVDRDRAEGTTARFARAFSRNAPEDAPSAVPGMAQALPGMETVGYTPEQERQALLRGLPVVGDAVSKGLREAMPDRLARDVVGGIASAPAAVASLGARAVGARGVADKLGNASDRIMRAFAGDPETPVGEAAQWGAGFAPLGGVAAAPGAIKATGRALRGMAEDVTESIPMSGRTGGRLFAQVPEAGEELAEAAGAGRAGILRVGGGVGAKPPRPPHVPEPQGTAYSAPIDDGADARLANLAKLNLSPQAEAKVRDAYTALDLDKRAVTWDETRAAATELGLDPEAVRRKSGRLAGHELLAVRDVISQNAKRMVDLATEKAGATTDDARRSLQGEHDKLFAETQEYLSRYSTERSRAGRDLNALRIVARNSMEPQVWLTQGQRVKGDLPLSGEEATRIALLAGKNDRDGLIRFVAGLHKSTARDKALSLWKAGLLTNPVTHIANVVGNASMAAAETAKEIPAAAIDAVISLVRGTERTKAVTASGLLVNPVTGGGFGRTGAPAGIAEGLRAARRVIQHGDDPEQLAKWDFRKVNFGDGPAGRLAQAYTETVFRGLSAQDALFRAVAVGRSLEEHSRLAARALVKDGTAKTFEDALKVVKADPPADVVLAAIADAEVATFQNPSAIADAISGFKRGLREGKAPVLSAAAEVTMPFVKTPTNVGAALVQYSPLGLVRALTKQISNPSQKALAEDLGRSITGSGLVALGFMLAAEGRATGAAPREAAERAQWELENKPANSVRIGDTWHNVSRISPLGALVAVGAQMHDAATNSESTVGKLAAGAFTPARVAMDQSFLKGVSGTLEAANDPARAGERLAENTVGSVVPAVVAAVARGTDPLRRAPSGIVERVESRIPGLSDNVPPKLNAFGEPVEQEGGIFAQLTGLTQPRTANDDPVVRELARLEEPIGFPSKTRIVAGKREARTPEDYAALLQKVGPETYERLSQLFANSGYVALPDEDRRALVSRTISQTRAAATGQERQELLRRTRATADSASAPRTRATSRVP